MNRALKKPEDYPLFYFRLKNQFEKDTLNGEVEATLGIVNRKFKKGQRHHKKGELLLFVLTSGLKQVRAGKLKLPE